MTPRALAIVGVLAAVCSLGCSDRVPNAATAPPTTVTPPIPPDGPEDRFVDVTLEAGIDFVHHVGDGRMDNLVEAVGAGATWFDADGDGRLDLYLVDGAWDAELSEAGRSAPGAGNRLYRNLGNGTFEDVTERAGVGDTAFGFMALAADFDGDGSADLLVLNHGPNRLYRNRGDGTFEDATTRAGLGDPRCSVAGAILDADGDGWLDVYVGNYVTFDAQYRTHYGPDVFPGPLAFSAQRDALYLNGGDGTFRDVSAEWGLTRLTPGRAMGVSPLDMDLDGDLDLFVANDATANFLLRNDRTGFVDVAAECGTAFGVQGEATAAMAGVVGDFDGDGRPDIHVTDAGYGSLYVASPQGVFIDRIFASRIASASGQWASWGGGAFDVDDDGDLDLLLVNGDLHRETGRPDLLLANDGSGRFDDVSAASGAYFRAEMFGRGGALADYDDDGDVDALVTCIGNRPVLLRNRGGSGRHHVTLDVRSAPGKIAAQGARVTVRAGGHEWKRVTGCEVGYLSQHDPRLRFGVGDATVIDEVVIEWPGGSRQQHDSLEVDRAYVARPGEGLQ